MKRIILLLSLSIIAITTALVFMVREEPEASDHSDTIPVYAPEMNSEPAALSTIAKTRDTHIPDPVHRYRVTLTTTMSNPTAQLGEMTYRFNMALKAADTQPNVYLGQIDDIQWAADSQGEDRPKRLTFTTQFSKGSFHNVDLLGLNDSHPLTIIHTTLTQFSYFSGRKTLTLADGKHRFYFVRQDESSLKRNWLGSVSDSQSYKITEQQDQWQLTHDAHGFPQTLAHTHTRTVDYENQQLTVVQQTTIAPLTSTTALNWSMNQYASRVNQHLKGLDVATASNNEAVSEANFAKQFELYAGSPNLDNAHVIGAYLANQGFNTVKDWLQNQNLTDNQQSLLIFALERSQSAEGETILSQLIEDNSLDEENRLRAIMSIAKMGDVNSTHALQTLEAASDNSNQIISETALLNIGILGNQSESLRDEVSSYLRKALQSEKASYLTLVSIDNLNDRTLDSQVSHYLASEHFDERMVAARVLARNPEMKPTLREQALRDSNPNVVREIVNARLSTPNSLPFDSNYQHQLRNRILDGDVPTPTKEMLFEYLMSGSENTSENQAVAEALYKEADLSESTRQTLAGLLNQ
ncbi:HEAT repeat domain-containing protein [Vibrio sp. S9_S30]|uniref:HEAT repeat domain-containing protein n=1 Tax=Vibrio sp. S9_S30 TaxID=2720226 RepID=UPI0016817F25|nr:HEAT repeat domain-containing protein [Vibrio sp. S9_S30]MBD1557706.1 HEAT repeat domain-containing protein [Vibrio sp. S9_S30]